MSEILSFSGDTSHELSYSSVTETPLRKRAPERKLEWTTTAEFEDVASATAHVTTDGVWSIKYRTPNAIVFRCTVPKARGVPCRANQQVFFASDSTKVSGCSNGESHTCQETRVLSGPGKTSWPG